MPKRKFYPLRSPTNTPAMDEAVDKLELLKVPVKRTSDHQLKCWEVNYWPDTGSISIDKQAKSKLRGLEAFLELVEKAAYAKGWRHHTKPVTITIAEGVGT